VRDRPRLEIVEQFSRDFGHLDTAVPYAVLRPGSVQDIAKMVRFARRHRLTVAMNGQGTPDAPHESHSPYGQALVDGGIAIDAKSLSTIHSISATEADVDAGVSWSELVVAAAAQGRTPPSLPDFLHLSIGGTASVGGIGGTMQRNGALVDTLTELDVVTGRGDVVTCSAQQRRDLFDAVPGGAGQFGIIVRARVKLVPAPERATIFNLYYDDLPTCLADHSLIMADERFTYQEGQLVAREDGPGWRYMIEAGAYSTPPDAPDQDQLLAGLSDDRSSLEVADHSYLEWVHRVDPVVGILRDLGVWDLPKPWLTLFVPMDRAEEFVDGVTADLTPDQLGAGLATMFPFRAASLHRPLFRVPDSPEVLQLTMLRFPFPGADIDGLLAQNRRLFDLAVGMGGTRYLVSAVPDLTVADHRAHYGDRWGQVRLWKHRFDPANVLTPGQAIFA
jgi:cytokinin dehydrogenase